MRKYHKKQLLDIVQTIKEANILIERYIKNENFDDAIKLLIDCHEGAVNVGSYIEELEGEGTITVTYLEEYCRLIYEIGVAINEGKNIKKEFIILHNQIIKVENSMINDIKVDKLEVVFLPYKASMWDSLESIYLAAKDDPQCSVYCVPIPYYELNQDRKPGQMHYEGSDYYDDSIEITSWQKYDIKERHPDLIFIHYPYDDMARNATIHPDFYSKILREHCECLVYVPYFVSPRNAVQDYNAYLPGVLYADCVIVQSEEVRQSYIQHYNRFNKEHNLNYVFGKAESKFIALGSPKYDKVINSKDADYKLPSEWEKLITKENGEKKKIILYNTHMFTWLNEGETYFEKIRTVFEIFKNRKDVVLWWRPHPNTELNFRTLRPDLFGKYIETVEKYRKEGWGIYDDTPDLHRAIACSDVYYGDGSSITELFRAKGKAIYYQNFNNTELLDNFGCHITNIFMARGELYALTFNGYLFKLGDKGFKYESKLPVSPSLPRYRNYYSQVINDDSIIFIPHYEKQITVYNSKTKEYGAFELELKDEYLTEDKGTNRNFFEGIIFKNKIYLVPCGYSSIVAFHLETKETEHCLDLRQLFPKNNMKSLSYGWTWLNENTVLLASMYTNEVLEFNLDTHEYKIHKIGRENQSFHIIFKYGEYYFLIGRQPFILKWNYETGAVVIYDKMPDNFKVTQEQGWVFYVQNLRPYKNKLVLPGGFTNMVLEFDLDSCEFKKLDVFDEIINRPIKIESNKDHFFITCIYMSDNFMYFVHKNEVLYRYDFITQEIEELCDIAPLFSTDELKDLNDSFISSMLKGENTQVKSNYGDNLNYGQSGKRIYDYVKAKVLK